jgi:hypothetical protein
LVAANRPAIEQKQSHMKKLVLIIVVLVVGGIAVLLGTRYKPAPAPAVQNSEAAQPATVAGVDATAPASEETSKTPSVFRRRTHSKAGEGDPMEVWDKQIDTILESKAPDAQIADKLLALYPQLPTNGQADLFVEIAPRVSDKDYSKLSTIVTNATTPEDVIDELLNDLIDRPDKVRMPVLLDLARTKDNPKAEDAHDLLEVILGDDYGEDWNVWSKKISEWISTHPEE